MRPAIVLIILGAALLATGMLRQQKEASFDARFENAEDRIRTMAEAIDAELEKSE